MRALCRGLAFAVAMAAIGSGGSARAQQATPQYYGYPAAQKSLPAGQVNYTCQPGQACQPDKYGCVVTVCACPCTASNACQTINSQIPPIHPVPTCQEPNVCTIVDEGPPTTQPQTITIHRNCYVPIRVVTQPGPSNVTPVNINVKWREVHVLCGPDGKPLSSDQAAAVLDQLNAQTAAAPSTPASAPDASVATVPPKPQASTTAEKPPQKHWVWLTDEKVYGFGYQKAEGLWVIDPGSKRRTLPEGQRAVNVTYLTGTTNTASN